MTLGGWVLFDVYVPVLHLLIGDERVFNGHGGLVFGVFDFALMSRSGHVTLKVTWRYFEGNNNADGAAAALRRSRDATCHAENPTSFKPAQKIPAFHRFNRLR